MYFAFVDRFRMAIQGQDNGFTPLDNVSQTANYLGGDFLGIIHAMQEDYFIQMGVNTIGYRRFMKIQWSLFGCL